MVSHVFENFKRNLTRHKIKHQGPCLREETEEKVIYDSPSIREGYEIYQFLPSWTQRVSEEIKKDACCVMVSPYQNGSRYLCVVEEEEHFIEYHIQTFPDRSWQKECLVLNEDRYVQGKFEEYDSLFKDIERSLMDIIAQQPEHRLTVITGISDEK